MKKRQSSSTQSQIPTAKVSFTYDTIYGRLATMSDGTGSTSYTYHPVGQPGALMPATIDGPLANNQISQTKCMIFLLRLGIWLFRRGV
ncbi:MAG: hypothetical protein ACK46A_03085 [Akkermansiaceae bacterium]